MSFPTRKFFCFLLCIFILQPACSSAALEVQLAPVDPARDLVDRIVALTLQAISNETGLTPEAGWGENAPGETNSFEVTQEPPPPAVNLDSGSRTEEQEGGLPVSHYIWNIWGHRQYFPIGCEAAAADDWAKYFGVEVNEFNFQMRLPISDNPDLGFVGDVNSPWGQVPPYAYGTHAMPVAAVLREYYGLNAVGVKGFTISKLKEQITADKPVIVWVIGNCTWSEPYVYTDQSGNDVITAPYEHVIIVTGYNEEMIRYMNNGKFFDVPYESFERSWSVLENMVIYLAE